jgi:hypothetical protein
MNSMNVRDDECGRFVENANTRIWASSVTGCQPQLVGRPAAGGTHDTEKASDRMNIRHRGQLGIGRSAPSSRRLL